jgi:hypothetical protein
LLCVLAFSSQANIFHRLQESTAAEWNSWGFASNFAQRVPVTVLGDAKSAKLGSGGGAGSEEAHFPVKNARDWQPHTTSGLPGSAAAFAQRPATAASSAGSSSAAAAKL